MLRIAAAVLVCALPLFAADQSCRWLDAATAAGFLGGPVTSRTTATACQFVQGRSKLIIEVRTFDSAHKQFTSQRARCRPNAEQLPATGNEAFVCPKKHEVVGRVRTAIFKVQLVKPTDAWQSNLKLLAQQVAGALF